MPDYFDAIILGAGLAGSTAGILLKEKGWSVLILEKSHYPKDKVCGEFLSPAVWPLIRRLGLVEAVKSRNGQEIDSVSFFWPNHDPIHAKLPSGSENGAHAYGISRRVLDHLFLREAEKRGCVVLQNHDAVKIRKNRFHLMKYTVHTEDAKLDEAMYSGRVIINATGRKNKRPGGKERSGKRAFGFKAHFKDVAPSHEIELYFFKNGYLGIVQIENGMSNICGKIAENEIRNHKGNFDALLESAANQNPALASRIKNRVREGEWISCGPLQEKFRGGYKEGVFHAGDAACFLEPFLGQGMTMALSGAALLGGLLVNTEKEYVGFSKVGKIYAGKLRKLYNSRIMMGHFLNLFIFSPVLGRPIQRFFSSRPSSLAPFIRTAFSLPQNSGS